MPASLENNFGLLKSAGTGNINMWESLKGVGGTMGGCPPRPSTSRPRFGMGDGGGSVIIKFPGWQSLAMPMERFNFNFSDLEAER